ncbi:hypothetical protein V1L52_08395 [Treponema sp. HNW]|uniref:hypothetical protein n=1 Tax=Treponema sp. HNW TaxID=3116654 RepID=UPI003D127B5E
MNRKSRFKRHKVFYPCFICGLWMLFSCTRGSSSSLTLQLESPSLSSNSAKTAVLKALNKNARSALITEPDKTPFLFFSFEGNSLAGKGSVQSLIASGGYALEIEVEIPAERDGSTQAGLSSGEQDAQEGFLFFGFLYEDDIVSNPVHSSAKHTKRIEDRAGIKASVVRGSHFKLSLGFDSSETGIQADISGFMLYSELPLALRAAKIIRADYGWNLTEGRARFAFSASGGAISSSVLKTAVPDTVFFQNLPAPVHECRELHIMFAPVNPSEQKAAGQTSPVQNAVELLCGSETLRIFHHPSMQSARIDMRAFKGNFDTVKILSGASLVRGIVVKSGKEAPFSPLSADPGLIMNWPRKNWRNSRFELFSWQRFPSVLILDFADYAVQDAFLKRLAFYVEKKEYAGRLLSDEKMQALHGFNAHDYRAESLASFFNQAEKEGFPLNQSELLLRDILFVNKVIIRRADGIVPGEGAIISISRESPRYLRHLFITHEGLHGIYFTEKNFRAFVDTVFYNLKESDPKAAAFLRRYFEVTPSLNYNTADTYLLKNEFMAYILQQKPSDVKRYFTDVLSVRRYISAAEPRLCEYVRKSEARSFVRAGEAMSAFLYDSWGIEGGNLFSILMD